MFTFVVRRVLQSIPVIIGVSFIVFIMMHAIPGDPAVIMAGEAARPEQVEQMRYNLGLNDPIIVQFLRYITNAVRGDLGTSIRTARPVVNEIFDARFATTVQLAFMGTVVSVLLGLIIGIVSVAWRYSFVDTLLTLVALFGMSIPNFLLGVLLMFTFAVNFQLVPAAGWGTPQQAILPVIMLGISGATVIARMTRASMMEVFNQDYIRTAYAKGASERIVTFRHALRNALIPVITVVGLQFGGLLAGAILTENIFAINGMGRLVIDSIAARDFPIAQGTILIFSLLFMLVNMIVDVAYRVVNKRIDVN